MKRLFLLLGATLLSFNSFANENVLPAEKAFQIMYGKAPNNEMMVRVMISPGYELYKGRFDADSGAKIKNLPEGIKKHDEFLGDVEVLTGIVDLYVDYKNVDGNSFNLYYQGCKPKVICYTPQIKNIELPIRIIN